MAKPKPNHNHSLKPTFFGSQVGGQPLTTLSYTDSPLTLLRQDILSAFASYLFLPFIVYPFNPLLSGHLCELYPSVQNIWCMFLHVILILLQGPFLLSIPFWVFFPVWMVLVAGAVFWVVNVGVWRLLNGKGGESEEEILVRSREEYASSKGHEHECWIFLNGVAVGRHWLQSNIDRLALTFRRPILGVHNPTNGILFDVLQCLIQRNFTYATSDIRACYRIVKAKLYSPDFTKVIFILHSQGGIEGGMIIDWLLQEVPQDLLGKLEVYTFGNAANHFNDPHLSLLGQNAALRCSGMEGEGGGKVMGRVAMSWTVHSVEFHDPISDANTPTPSSISNGNGNGQAEQPSGGNENSNSASTNGDAKGTNSNLPNPTPQPNRTIQESTTGKTIRHIEHYAHTYDFVARWGVLNFVGKPTTYTAPRFMGRVFERPGEGHQFCMHYLDAMFPLAPATPPKPTSSSHNLSNFSSSSSTNPDSKTPSNNEEVQGGNRKERKSLWRNWWNESRTERGGIGNSGFSGALEMGNKFMESIMILPSDNKREGPEMSYLSTHGEPLSGREKEVLLRDMSPISPGIMWRLIRGRRVAGVGGRQELSSVQEIDGDGDDVEGGKDGFNGEGKGDGKEGVEGVNGAEMEFRVKDLSRLWLYVNGKSPKEDDGVGLRRMATI